MIDRWRALLAGLFRWWVRFRVRGSVSLVLALFALSWILWACQLISWCLFRRGHWLWSKVICFGFSVVVARGVRICEFVNCGLVLCGGACGPIQFWRLDLRRVPDISLGEGAGLVCLFGFQQSPGEAVNIRIGSFVLRSSFRTGLWASRILPGTVSPCDMSTTYCELLWLRDSFALAR
ncbi:hypothetical protein DY000_02017722 [Brassica cretica]|uniref:Uncharacterized protein n=1 Tax=Brassica cretica TaxID=69181 RepID=A0ABQ7D1H0_BRACR|nr:hypothetical protein DY000_02017722 [Brassica cretica]